MGESKRWKYCGHNFLESSSAQRHTSAPTRLVNGRNIVTKEDAIETAQYAQRTRCGGRTAYESSKNTVIAISAQELDEKLAELPRNGNEVTIPGTYYGYNIELRPGGEVKSVQSVEITDPVFKMKKNKAVHFSIKDTKIKHIWFLSPDAPIMMDF
ncbi:hypothetical protein FO519_009979 [Halicephalobus sp. NKZ332]|nr:hypothetical protein FO519_009979 [Halicephalobus sp. NKZ332]